jgi:hypothetical protein
MNTICPDPGQLRAWLDRDDRLAGGIAAVDGLASHRFEDHLAACDACQTTLVTLERDADFAARVLEGRAGSPPTARETEAALARLRARLAASADPTQGAINRAPADHPAVGARLIAPPTVVPTTDIPLASGGARRHDSLPLSASERGPGAVGVGGPMVGVIEVKTRRIPVPIALVWQRWRLALGGVAAALALTFALATPEGQAAAAGFLAQFRSQRLAIVSFDPNQARQTGLFRFEHLGTVKNNQPARPTEVANVQEAASRAGFAVLQPDPATLPAGAARSPIVRFAPASETRLTFDRQKARAHFDSINRKDLSLPDKLHGSTLVVALPPVVMLEYAASDKKPAVMIGEAREVQVAVEGSASLDEVRNFLLGLPNVPPDLARQLRSIQDWTSTLPIPVPIDKMTWQETTVHGAPGYMLNDNTGLGSSVIWQRDGRILGVAGPMKAMDLRRIAESLR